MKKQANAGTTGSDKAVRIFRALAVLLLGVAVGYFVYTTTVHTDSRYPFRLGLDLAGGSHLVYEANVSGVAPADVSSAMATLRDVIERRTNTFGVSEPIVQVEKGSVVANAQSERLVVELPFVLVQGIFGNLNRNVRNDERQIQKERQVGRPFEVLRQPADGLRL